MTHEWRKTEKNFYLPKNKPEKIFIPKFNFYSIEGKGNPNDDFFAEYIQVLYSLSYGIRMSYKSGHAPASYYEYTVYPLEGVWDIDEDAKKNFSGTFDKNTLVFKLMMRQPDFVTPAFAREMIELTMKKKPSYLLKDVKFGSLEEGHCVQMLHLGSYDSECESFAIMEQFTKDQHLTRASHKHREIYLSEPRKVAPDQLKTVLRFKVS